VANSRRFNSIPASQGRIAGYRIGEEQSGGDGAILQPVSFGFTDVPHAHRACKRFIAIAAVLDGASREEAAKIGGMDRQTLRDWVIRFNEQGADGLMLIPLSDGSFSHSLH
jgi:hypothetical protein